MVVDVDIRGRCSEARPVGVRVSEEMTNNRALDIYNDTNYDNRVHKLSLCELVSRGIFGISSRCEDGGRSAIKVSKLRLEKKWVKLNWVHGFGDSVSGDNSRR